jgi:CDP-diacylglycerol--glycerol-3-phosphate 3-phosphatidyltransferase
VPACYTFLEREFLGRVAEAQCDERVALCEYTRPDWTFHAKGLWATLPNESAPALTFIGSPNFGHRSVHRDLEAQVGAA